MAANKWMNKLLKHEGAVIERRNPHANVIRTPSPSFDFIFGNGWGLPVGFSAVLYGPPKGGKTFAINAIIGQLHKSDPDAIVLKYDTEMRERAQLTPDMLQAHGIDLDRYVAYEVNEPQNIFDHIEKDVAAQIDDGAPIKLIVIDSMTNIVGRRAMNADTVNTQQIGDDAATIQAGLKRILPILRRKNVALIMTSQLRAEMDPGQQRLGKTDKMAGAFAMKHFAEYFIKVEPHEGKAGRTTLSGKELVNEDVTDLMDKGEKIGHKIRVKMVDSSLGPKGRVGEFTLDYRKGIINTHEEVFLLGVNRGVIEKPNMASYVFGKEKWHGKEAMLNAIRDNRELSEAILKEIRLRDAQGNFDLPEDNSEESSESSEEFDS